MKSTASKYGWLAQTFHWLSALLILSMIPIGISMTRITEGPTRTMLYQAHVGLGLTVLALTLLRILWRFIEPTPDVPPGLSPLRQFVFKAIHVGQYALLIALTASGIGILLSSGLGLSPASVLPAAIARDLPAVSGHAFLSKVFIALLLAHFGGMLEYQIFRGNVLARMGLPLGRRN